MKKKYHLLLLMAFLLPLCNPSYAQLYGTVGAGAGTCSVFLPGAYLEIGINNCGAFGAVVPGTDAAPSTYNPYLCCGPGPNPLAEVYDYGHDGWTVGTPNFYGDYTYPGSPFEGWEIQTGTAGTARGQAFTTGTASTYGNTGGMGLNGWLTSYVDAGGQLTANWAGTTATGLAINMQSTVDTFGNTVNVTVTLKNTSAAVINDVYYLRSCDPDNDEAHGGSFATDNVVLHQNELPSHDVEVDAEGAMFSDHWSLCTKDCRAKAFVYSSWPISISENLSTIWSTETVTGGSEFTLGTYDDGDIAIGLLFNIGNIAVGDSAVLAYAYVFNDPYSTIDSAFPDPVLSVNGSSVPNAPIPYPTVDSFQACGTAITSLPVNILNATTGTWTWSQWNWAPATGLATTTGVNNTINIVALPPTITYTITGTDSAAGGFTCNNKTFYLTITTCNTVLVNLPCAGDTLQFRDLGDSVGVTYLWTGPGGFTSTLQNPFIYPASTADIGEYYVTRYTPSGVDSTDSVHAYVHSLPVVTGSSNAPLCAGAVDTLHLFASPDSAGESFYWTGPNSFTSSLQNPSINGFTFLDSGTYKVVTSYPGCADSTTIYVGIITPPPTLTLTSAEYCQQTGTTTVAVSGLQPGATVLWYPTAAIGTGGSTVTPVINLDSTGTKTYYATETVGSCESNVDSAEIVINPTPAAPVLASATYCQIPGTSTTSVAVTGLAPGATLLWYPSAAGGTGTATAPVINLDSPATVVYFAAQVEGSCQGPIGSATITVNPTPPAPVLASATYCQQPGVTAIAVSGVVPGATVLWYPTAVTTGTGSSTAPSINLDVVGTTTYYATEIEGICQGPVDSATIVIKETPAAPNITGQIVYCQFDTAFYPLTVTPDPGATVSWYTSLPLSGPGLSTEPAVNLSVSGNNNFYVTQTLDGCQGPDTMVTITVNQKPALPVITPQVYCQYLSSGPEVASPSEGGTLYWFGTDTLLPGSTTAPTPSTAVPGIDSNYVQQSITTLGKTCYSYFALDQVVIAPQPAPPITDSIKYCQFATAVPLTAIGQNLYWYSGGSLIDSTTGPVPPTNITGTNTWYVTQSIDSLGITCQSDSASLVVTTIYLPNFAITPTSPYVCQFDSLSLSYTGTGTTLQSPNFTWVLPAGATAADGSVLSGASDTTIVVKFDSLGIGNNIYLTATDDSGFCSTTDTIFISVISQPSGFSYIQPNVCLGDTTSLSLSSESADASLYSWTIDGTPLTSSSEVNIITASSNSGGPYTISWNDTGIHFIELTTYTAQECVSVPSYDTVFVHPLPDATFGYITKTETVCLDDSVQFNAATYNENDAYVWSPAYSFNNINSPSTWGKVDGNSEVISLTVTDPLGCTATTQQTLDASSCCTVGFPNAFTPGATINRVFRPIMSGYHNFHEFRIANRWGQTLFESSGTNISWDGNFDGVPQDMGVYYYYIKFDCGGNTVEQKGDVTLVR